jgi:hypothetical protein
MDESRADRPSQSRGSAAPARDAERCSKLRYGSRDRLSKSVGSVVEATFERLQMSARDALGKAGKTLLDANI